MNITRTHLQRLQSDWLWKQNKCVDEIAIGYKLWSLSKRRILFTIYVNWKCPVATPRMFSLPNSLTNEKSSRRGLRYSSPLGLVIKLQSSKLFLCKLFSQHISWDYLHESSNLFWALSSLRNKKVWLPLIEYSCSINRTWLISQSWLRRRPPCIRYSLYLASPYLIPVERKASIPYHFTISVPSREMQSYVSYSVGRIEESPLVVYSAHSIWMNSFLQMTYQGWKSGRTQAKSVSVRSMNSTTLEAPDLMYQYVSCTIPIQVLIFMPDTAGVVKPHWHRLSHTVTPDGTRLRCTNS